MKEMRGLRNICKYGHPQQEGRFGRLFKDLPPFYMDPCKIDRLTEVGGIMDAGNTPVRIDLPAGFVILGQFIDHDITLDVTSTLDRNNDPDAIRNFRTPTLDLDCIYGGGPEASPYLYQKDGLRLHTGATSTAYTGYSQPGLEKYDLSRTSDGTAIIGDPRNDENRILSQLQLAFIKFHNCVADYLEAEARKHKPEKGSEKEVEIGFEDVRRLVTWHYQWIVLHEFLPHFVGQDLVDDILCYGRLFYRPRSPFIPIEFSAAAYRFGHSMVPLEIRVQPGGPAVRFFGSELGFGFTPLPSERAIVDMDLLFGCVQEYERAEALDIRLASDLLNLRFIEEGDNKNLANRNILRGQSFLLPSGEEVARLMKEEMSQHRDLKVDLQVDEVRDFLRRTFQKIDYQGCTPLWFYILAEAEVLHNGKQMGSVGGRIVGETIIGLMELDEMSFLGSNRLWKPELSDEKDCRFRMCDLVRFCERRAKRDF
jgi:hypothetical protein